MQRLKEFYRKPLPVADDHKDLFGSAMHDSGIFSLELRHKELFLRLDNIEAQDFARVYSKHIGKEIADVPMPVELVCHDVDYVNAVRAKSLGHLVWTDWEALLKDPVRQTEFLYDWFYEQDGRLQWIVTLYLRGFLYLMVDCSSASAIDRRRSTLVKLFDETAGQFWDQVLIEARNRYMWNDEILGEFLRDRM